MSVMACNTCGTVYGPTILACPKCGSGDVGRVDFSPEALPSNNASESNQSPSPSEQEDKPTTKGNQALFDAGYRKGQEDLKHQLRVLLEVDKWQEID